MSITNQQRARRIAIRINTQVQRGAAKGIQAAAKFLAARIKEAVSEPAPRKAVRAAPLSGQKKGSILYYRASTPATPGAPPRKLSGRLRTSITSAMLTPTSATVGTNARAVLSRKYPQGFNYPRYLETGQGNKGGAIGAGPHPFIGPTVAKFMPQLRAIAGKALRLSLKRS